MRCYAHLYHIYLELKLKLLFTVLLSLCLISSSFGTVYFVDATDGDNANSGLSPAEAWQTLGKVNVVINAAGFAAGDSILFQRGETFVGQLVNSNRVGGTPGNPIVFSAYDGGGQSRSSARVLSRKESIPVREMI